MAGKLAEKETLKTWSRNYGNLKHLEEMHRSFTSDTWRTRLTPQQCRQGLREMILPLRESFVTCKTAIQTASTPAFWIAPVQERHWQTPAENTKLVRKLEHKVGWRAKRGWGRRACSGPRKDSGVCSGMPGNMISKNQKLEHWTSSLDTGNNFLTTGAVKNWNRGCWCSL